MENNDRLPKITAKMLPWAMLVMVVALIIRTSLEDRMLREELDGYQSYTEETPYRLIPGLW